MDLSTPAIALLTMLQDGQDPDSLHLREHFSREFPEADYDECLVEIKNSGMHSEPASISWGNSRKVRFSKLSPLHLRTY
jgi:hypothetical protein